MNGINWLEKDVFGKDQYNKITYCFCGLPLFIKNMLKLGQLF